MEDFATLSGRRFWRGIAFHGANVERLYFGRSWFLLIMGSKKLHEIHARRLPTELVDTERVTASTRRLLWLVIPKCTERR
jgi:hypothetical protein